jgi:hypothetical protein
MAEFAEKRTGTPSVERFRTNAKQEITATSCVTEANSMSTKAWFGFDIDKTAFVDEEGSRGGAIGEPVQGIIRRIKYFLRTGRTVCIVTARVNPREPDWQAQSVIVHNALVAALGEEMANQISIRCDKDRHMIDLYDDRTKQVIPNRGILVQNELRRAVEGLMVIARGDGGASHAAAVLMNLEQWSRDLVNTSD